MKKILALAVLTGILAFQADAQWNYPSGPVTLSQTVLGSTMTNINTGSFKVSQIVLTSVNNATVSLVDSFTNLTTYVTLPYTNITYALTNAGLLTNGYTDFAYTNYYGVVNYLTNVASYPQQFVIVEVTNSVAQTTNTLPAINLSVQANVPLVINNLNQTFYRGIWATNTSPATTNVTVTIIGQRN